jgi:uncharacterized protein DUF1206
VLAPELHRLSHQSVVEEAIILSGSRSAAEAVKVSAERAGRAVSPWADRLGRAGQLAQGVVYVTVGVIALEAALGAGAQATGVGGAFGSIARMPFGGVLLAGLALGLSAHAVRGGPGDRQP